MTQQKALLGVVCRLITDEDFRKQLLIAPKETLSTELGISAEDYQALVALVPLLLAGGMFVLGGGISPDGEGWGRWGSS